MNESSLRLIALKVVSRMSGSHVALTSVARKPLRGGISADVVAVAATYSDRTGRPRVARFVVKELRGCARRELAIYHWLEANHVSFVPGVLASIRTADAMLLALEQITRVARWPWRNTAHGEAVLRVAAELHRRAIASAIPWNYEAELQGAAAETHAVLAAARRTRVLHVDAASLRSVRRIAAAVTTIHREVAFRGPFARALVHGDLHPGNVILAQRAGAAEPVLVDWGRARLGSPLEDVASWIQSLGCWEPEARRRHDSLLAEYLRARGCGSPITIDIRRAYWLAGATNALAGALLHHLGVATSRSAPRSARARALAATHDWLRIIRRAEAMWLEPEVAPRGVRDRRSGRSYAPLGSTPPP